MRQALQTIGKFRGSSANSPRGEAVQVPVLSELVHAVIESQPSHADPRRREAAAVSPVRTVVFAGGRARRAHEAAHRRKALPVQLLSRVLCDAGGLPEAHGEPHAGPAVPVRHLPGVVPQHLDARRTHETPPNGEAVQERRQSQVHRLPAAVGPRPGGGRPDGAAELRHVRKVVRPTPIPPDAPEDLYRREAVEVSVMLAVLRSVLHLRATPENSPGGRTATVLLPTVGKSFRRSGLSVWHDDTDAPI